MFEYKLICTNRRTIGVEVLKDGTLVVRAPMRCPEHLILQFLNEKQNLIKKYLEQVKTLPPVPTISRLHAEALRREAEKRILPRVEQLSKITGLNYGNAKITMARRRFGSCSGKNNLCFSAFLCLASSEEIDYVIIHELCHTVEHNHSSAFYSLVSSYLPDWKQREIRLRKITIPEILD